MHIGESGAAEPDDDSFYRSRRNRYGYDEDGDDKEADVDASFSAATVDDNWQYVDEWRDTEDRVAEFGRIPLAAGELLPAGALDGEPPDEKRLTEASGNEGTTYERSYRRAVLVRLRRAGAQDRVRFRRLRAEGRGDGAARYLDGGGAARGRPRRRGARPRDPGTIPHAAQVRVHLRRRPRGLRGARQAGHRQRRHV